MTGRFTPGDHLRVQRRPWLYYHHGIYVSDERVIQFGSGVNLLDKSRTAVNAVTLEEFEQGGTAERVRHGYEDYFGTGHHPAADEPWKIIERAEFMLKLQHRLPYNLIGHNCEIVANMCASQNWTESYQVRRWFRRKAAADALLFLWISGRSRAGRPIPGGTKLAIAASAVLGYAAIATYNDQIRRLWKEIRDDWLAHERALDEEPHNGLQS